MLNLVVNNNFKINRKVIDKEFVKIQIARKTGEKNIHLLCSSVGFFTMYKLCIYQDEYGEMYDRR